jgi:hypothetical protein
MDLLASASASAYDFSDYFILNRKSNVKVPDELTKEHFFFSQIE